VAHYRSAGKQSIPVQIPDQETTDGKAVSSNPVLITNEGSDFSFVRLLKSGAVRMDAVDQWSTVILLGLAYLQVWKRRWTNPRLKFVFGLAPGGEKHVEKWRQQVETWSPHIETHHIGASGAHVLARMEQRLLETLRAQLDKYVRRNVELMVKWRAELHSVDQFSQSGPGILGNVAPNEPLASDHPEEETRQQVLNVLGDYLEKAGGTVIVPHGLSSGFGRSPDLSDLF
jgi:hypothetical protein